MKKLFTLVILFSLHQTLKAQSFQWAINAGSSTYSHITSLKQDRNGDIYMSSYEDSMGHLLGTSIEKRNSLQAIDWRMRFPVEAIVTDIEINSANNAIVVGHFMGNIVIGFDTLRSPLYNSAFIFEVTNTGVVTWTKLFNPDGDGFEPVDLCLDKFDNIYITANLTGGSNHGFCSFHKLDLWGNSIRDEFNSNFEDRTFSHIIADSVGNVFISGTCGQGATFDGLTVTPNISYQNMLVKYDSSFTAQWVISRTYITFDDNNGLGTDGESLYWSFLQAGSSFDTIHLVKTDYNGNILLDINGPLQGAFFPSNSLSVDPSGNSVLMCNVFTRIYLYRYDPQFNLTFSDTIEASISGFPPEIQITCYDSMFYLGSRYSNDSVYFGNILLQNPLASTFGYGVFVSKWGYSSTTGIPNINSNSGLSIFPNPANEFLDVYYSENNDAIISMIDITGKVVLSKNISGGNQRVDVSNLNAGLYVLKVENKSSGAVDFSKVIVSH